MRYHNITMDDMNNGVGLRAVLWLSGCSHECRGCQNPLTWNPNDGLIFDAAAKNELWGCLSKDYIDGLTLSGGDPLYEGNRAEVEALVRQIKDDMPEKTIWLYTGYDYEEINELKLLDYIDVVVDGKYIEDLRDVTMHWAGSTNQRVIDVKASKEEGKIVLYEKDC